MVPELPEHSLLGCLSRLGGKSGWGFLCLTKCSAFLCSPGKAGWMLRSLPILTPLPPPFFLPSVLDDLLLPPTPFSFSALLSAPEAVLYGLCPAPSSPLPCPLASSWAWPLKRDKSDRLFLCFFPAGSGRTLGDLSS